nr:ethylene-responsive transcription factor 13-like [Ipomoea batatas]
MESEFDFAFLDSLQQHLLDDSDFPEIFAAIDQCGNSSTVIGGGSPELWEVQKATSGAARKSCPLSQSQLSIDLLKVAIEFM